METMTELKPASGGDFDFGQLLVKLNKATQNQVNKCLELQAKYAAEGKNPVPRLGELLVSHGYVDSRTVDEVLALQRGQSSAS
jgi:hypothetical protein